MLNISYITIFLLFISFSSAFPTSATEAYFIEKPDSKESCAYNDKNLYIKESKIINPLYTAVLNGNILTIDYSGESGDWFVEDVYVFNKLGHNMKRVYNDIYENISIVTNYSSDGKTIIKLKQNSYDLRTKKKVLFVKAFDPNIPIGIFEGYNDVKFISLISENSKKSCGKYSLVK